MFMMKKMTFRTALCLFLLSLVNPANGMEAEQQRDWAYLRELARNASTFMTCTLILPKKYPGPKSPESKLAELTDKVGFEAEGYIKKYADIGPKYQTKYSFTYGVWYGLSLEMEKAQKETINNPTVCGVAFITP